MYPDIKAGEGEPDADLDELARLGFNFMTSHAALKGATKGMLDYHHTNFANHIFAVTLKWLPAGGWVAPADNLLDKLRYAARPVMCLSIYETAFFYRVSRGEFIATLQEDFVLVARAKGLPTSYIITRHVPRPSLASLITFFGLSLGRLLGGALAGASVQGIGFGAMTTASFAIVDKVLPVSRRGEGVGYFGVSQPIVQGVGAAASFAVMAAAGFTRLFLAVAVIAALTTVAFALIRVVSRPWRNAGHPPLLAALHIGRPLVIPIIVCSTLSVVGGALILAIPMLGLEVGVSNPGIFYLASAVLGVLARLTTGRLSDRWGRARVAIPGLLLMACAIAGLVATADLGTVAFVVGGAFHGIATAAILPAIQSLVLDRSPLDRRGSSSAAMGMAFDVGFGTGSILIGAVASIAGPSAALLVTATVPLVSVGLLGVDARRQARAG